MPETSVGQWIALVFVGLIMAAVALLFPVMGIGLQFLVGLVGIAFIVIGILALLGKIFSE